jgi:hypothetical protein
MTGVKAADKKLGSAIDDLAQAQGQGVPPTPAAQAAQEAPVTRAAADLETEAREDNRRWMRRVNIVLLVVLWLSALIALLVGRPWSGQTGITRHAFSIAVAVDVAILTVLAAINWHGGRTGLLGYVQGRDRRLSTGLTQAALWTIALTMTLLYFTLLDFFSTNESYDFTETVGGNLQQQYLFLLGGPFAAAAAARVLTGGKVEDGTLQKVDSTPQVRDVVTDDGGQGNLPDAQFFAFNVVALTWFALTLWQTPDKLPTLPNVLVGLTSLSALGYATAKAVAGNKPLIASIVPYVGAGDPASDLRTVPGSSIEIRGSNFVPEGAGGRVQLARIRIRFRQKTADGASSSVATLPRFVLDAKKNITFPSDASLVALVPASLVAGTAEVTVITAAGAESDPADIVVEHRGDDRRQAV